MFTGNFRPLAIVLLLALTLGLSLQSSCSSGGDGAQQVPDTSGSITPPQQPQALEVQGFNLPAPSTLLKGFSFVDADRFQTGSQYSDALPSNLVTRTDPIVKFTPNWTPALDPGPAFLAYAMYAFPIAGYSGSSDLKFVWQAPLGDTAQGWVGLANRTADRWDWFSLPADGLLGVNSFASYLPPGGDLVMVVLLTGTGVHQLNWVRVGDTIPPQVALVSYPMQGSAPLNVQLNASDNSDVDGTVVNFKWDFEGDGTYDADTGSTPTCYHIYDTPGDYYAVVRITDDEGGVSTASTFVDVNLPPAGIFIFKDPNDPDWGPPVTGQGTQPDPYVLDAEDLSKEYSFIVNDQPDGSGNSLDPARYNWFMSVPGNGTFVSAGVFKATGNIDCTVYAKSITDESNHVYLKLTANVPPEAAFSADPLAGEKPLDVNFDASASTDSDGTIVQYEWDWDSNTVYDDTTASPTTTHTFNTNGVYKVTLRVTDDRGGTDTATDVYIGVANAGSGNSWHVVSADAASNVGPDASLAYIGGRPCIAYYDEQTAQLCFIRANNPFGTNWAAKVQVLSSDATGANSMELIDAGGMPGIAYYNYLTNELKYVRADAADGSIWGTPVLLDTLGMGSELEQLKAIGTYLAVLYYDASVDEARFIRAIDGEGTSWGFAVTVGPADDDAFYGGLATDGSNLAACYYNSSTDDLIYVLADDINGASWGFWQTVQSSGDVGQYCTMVFADGLPAISYLDADNSTLNVIRAAEISGGIWSSPNPLVTDATQLDHMLMTTLSGMPAVTFYSSAGLRYLRATSADGSTWGSEEQVDTSVGVQQNAVSPADYFGYPAVAYSFRSSMAPPNGDLKFAIYY